MGIKKVYVVLWLSGFLIAGNAISEGQLPKNRELMETIIAGVRHNEMLTEKISLDYVIDVNTSEETIQQTLHDVVIRRKEIARQKGETWDGNGVTIATLISIGIEKQKEYRGLVRSDGERLYLEEKVTGKISGTVFSDQICSYDGQVMRQLERRLFNNEGESKVHPTGKIYRRTEFGPNPLTRPVTVAGVYSLSSYLDDPNAKCKVVGKEDVEGVECYVIERTEAFVDSFSRHKVQSSRLWIAPERGFLVKKVQGFTSHAGPFEQVVVENKCDLKEVAEGAWYYSDIVYKSYAFGLPEPAQVHVVKFRNIKVGQDFKEDELKVIFPVGCPVSDSVNGVNYRAGRYPEGLAESLDCVVDETFEEMDSGSEEN